MTTQITLEDGKYTLIVGCGTLQALRHGEPWRDLTGDKLVGALADTLLEQQENNRAAAKMLEEVVESWASLKAAILSARVRDRAMVQMVLDTLLDATAYIDDVLDDPSQLQAFDDGVVQCHSERAWDAIQVLTQYLTDGQPAPDNASIDGPDSVNHPQPTEGAA